MTDISAVNAQRVGPAVPGTAIAGAQDRKGDLEQARRSATENSLAQAQDAKERRSEQFRESSELISRAIGANTRLEISSGEGSNTFSYRAIDVDTGEVVSEWPGEDFANLLAVLARTNPAQQPPTGVILDEQA